MFKVLLTEAQLKGFYACLDTQLKQGGLSTLEGVLDLHNALARAVVVPEKQPEFAVEEKKVEE